MTKDQTWLLLQEGYNVREIAAAAGVGMAVALGMVNQAIPRISKQARPKLSLTASAASTQTRPRSAALPSGID